MGITILVKQVYWYISWVSGERLQDHWSSGWVVLMKWDQRNKTDRKRLKMVIFKLLVLSYVHTSLYFFISLSEQYQYAQVLPSVKIQEIV